MIHTLERCPYLAHAIAPGTPVPLQAQLRMTGEIRLGRRWRRFTATETLHRDRGFVWKARVGWIFGADSLLDGAALSQWRLLGLVPVATASGIDVDRSAIGRWMAESLLLPGMLLPEAGAEWNGPCVTLHRGAETATLTLKTDADGRLQDFRLLRWGNPGGRPYGYYPFGGTVHAERRFEGIVIPSRLTLGWHYGTPEWPVGEFFRATITDAQFAS